MLLKPTTFTLTATEWRGLIQMNMTHAQEFVQQNAAISPEQVKSLHDHLDRVKELIASWHLAQPAPSQGAVNAQPPAAPPLTNAQPSANRAERRRARR